MRESLIERHLVRRVKASGGEAKKLLNRNEPDRLCLWPKGVSDFVECKAPGKKPRPGQEREHVRLFKLGFSVLVIDTVEKVDDYIRRRTT